MRRRRPFGTFLETGWTPFDQRLFLRTVAAGLLAWVACAGVVVTTDEATSTLGMRVARLAALTPLVAAVAALLVTAHARVRGELRALESLGHPPWIAARGAAAAGAILVLLGAAFLVSPLADASSLFPAVRAAVDWHVDAGGFVARAAGVVLMDDGAVHVHRASVVGRAPSISAWAALPSLGTIGLAVPSWAVTPIRLASRLASVGLTFALVVTGLHLVAAGRAPASVGFLSAAPLFLTTALARRAARDRG